MTPMEKGRESLPLLSDKDNILSLYYAPCADSYLPVVTVPIGDPVRKEDHPMSTVCPTKSPKLFPIPKKEGTFHDLWPISPQVDTSDPTVYVHDHHASCLLRSSCFLAIPAICGLCLRFYDLGVISLAVFLSSINHWRRPRLGCRRKIDMVTVTTAILYHTFVVSLLRFPQRTSSTLLDTGEWIRFVWYIGLILTVTCYVIGRYCCSKGLHDVGTKLHLSVHLLGGGSNLFLYCGIYYYSPGTTFFHYY